MKTRMIKLISIVLILTLALTAEVAKADLTFGEPTNLGPIGNSSADDGSPSISDDGLSLYFHSLRSGVADLWVTTRATTNDDWGEPVNLGPVVNSSAAEVAPSISADGLELYFCDWGDPRPGGLGEADLWVTTRPTKDDEWGEPVNLGPNVNSSAYEGTPEISADGLELYFESDRPGGYGFDDIYVTTRATTEDDWGTPVNLGPTANGSLWEHCPTISADGLTLFFDIDFPAGDLMMTRRATKDDDWGEPVNLGHSASDHWASDISADNSTLFLMSERDGGFGGNDLWQVTITPIVDFNGDGIVDAADIFIMVDHWGTDEPLCDIGPTPLGDGIIDVQDLIVLAEHLFEDYRLIGHWKLDDGEGVIAVDSSGNGNDGTLEDGPTFVDGQFRQALAFEGSRVAIPASDSLTADLFQGSFTLSAWINPKRTGGTWQQIFRSMIAADTSNDTLFINNDGRLSWRGRIGGDWAGGMCETASDVVPADQWTHVAVTGDGTNFRIYVNGALSQESAFQTTDGANATYYIGGDPTWLAESYAGIIDDVRIYNVALSAEEIEALAQ